MRNTTAMILVSALLGGCSTDLVDLSWNGPGQIGTIRSAEWIRYKTTSDITFTGELTLNFFVLTDQEDFCTSYQDAVGSTFGAFEAFEAARQPYEDADDLRNPALCELTRDYYLALGDAVDGLTQPGSSYLSTSFGRAATALEEGQPVNGTISLPDNPLLEDGDFFRTYLRFYRDNPYYTAAADLDCQSEDWGNATELPGFAEFVAEPNPDTSGGGTLQSQVFEEDDVVLLAHQDVLLVDRDRTSAGVLQSEAEYLKCEIETHEYFLRLFER